MGGDVLNAERITADFNIAGWIARSNTIIPSKAFEIKKFTIQMISGLSKINGLTLI
jgi:hypothetical protein